MTRTERSDPVERRQGSERIASGVDPMVLESGRQLSDVTVAYETYGRLNAERSNGVLVCHALTGSAHAAGVSPDGRSGWWSGLIGPGLGIDTDRFFVICSNVLGGCYGTTGPVSRNPETGELYGTEFPSVSIRDMVRAQRRLLKRLGIDRLYAVAGGSMGGMQAYEWGVSFPNDVGRLIVIAGGSVQSPWRRGLNAVVREGLELGRAAGNVADGLRLARKIATLTYRGHREFTERFGHRPHPARNRLTGRAGSVEHYLNRQARKLAERFDIPTYELLLNAMDGYDIARGRGPLNDVLRSILQPTLCVGISSDILYPTDEVRTPATVMRNGRYRELISDCGHDAFLIEREQLGRIVNEFLTDPDSTQATDDAGEPIGIGLPPEHSTANIPELDQHL